MFFRAWLSGYLRERQVEQRWVQMDIAKGVGILIIVFGHGWFVASSPDLLYPLLASFILPLFFFLSGVFFKTSASFTEIAVGKADALLKPFFFTMFLYVLVRNLLRDQPLLPDVGGLFYASVNTLPWQALWFLPHFWLAILYSWLLLRLLESMRVPVLVTWTAVIVQLLLGIWLLGGTWNIPVTLFGQAYNLPGLPFSADVVFISSAYFLLGYLLRAALRAHQTSMASLVIGATLFGLVFFFHPVTMDLAQRRYDHWLWTTVLAVLGVYVCWALSGLMTHLDWLSRGMTYVGQSTLIILIFHGEIQNKTFSLLRQASLPDYLSAFIAFVFTVIVSLAIAEVIKRSSLLRFIYMPMRKKKRSRGALTPEGSTGT